MHADSAAIRRLVDMKVTTILSGARTAIAVLLVPASVLGGVWAALWGMDSGFDPAMVVFPISLASLVLVAVMERILPYRREWNRSHGDLHRWHHSRVRRESDTNYGNVYIFWDVIFGTRFLPKDRKPPAQVGLGGMEAFPSGFFAQWISPFRWSQIRRESMD